MDFYSCLQKFLIIIYEGEILEANMKKEKPRKRPRDPPNSDTKEIKS